MAVALMMLMLAETAPDPIYATSAVDHGIFARTDGRASKLPENCYITIQKRPQSGVYVVHPAIVRGSRTHSLTASAALHVRRDGAKTS